MWRLGHFKGLCVLMKACVGVGEPAQALPLPVPHTAVGRSCALDTEARGNGGTPASHQNLDQKPRYHSHQGHFLL